MTEGAIEVISRILRFKTQRDASVLLLDCERRTVQVFGMGGRVCTSGKSGAIQ